MSIWELRFFKVLTLSTQQFLRLPFKTQRKTDKFSFKYFVCHVFPCKTLITAKDVLLLLRHRYQSPVARSKLKFLTFFDKKAYLNAEIFFGFSNSEFINDNHFSFKNKKSDVGTLRKNVTGQALKDLRKWRHICSSLWITEIFIQK